MKSQRKMTLTGWPILLGGRGIIHGTPVWMVAGPTVRERVTGVFEVTERSRGEGTSFHAYGWTAGKSSGSWGWKTRRKAFFGVFQRREVGGLSVS